jgi:hypothetical protein
MQCVMWNIQFFKKRGFWFVSKNWNALTTNVYKSVHFHWTNLPLSAVIYLFHEAFMKRKTNKVRFEVFTAVKTEVVIFWVVMLCSMVVGYQCFGGLCCCLSLGPVQGTFLQHFLLAHNITPHLTPTLFICCLYLCPLTIHQALQPCDGGSKVIWYVGIQPPPLQRETTQKITRINNVHWQNYHL